MRPNHLKCYFRGMETKEIRYSDLVHKLLTKTIKEDIPDVLDYNYSISPLKGIAFYNRILRECDKHWSTQNVGKGFEPYKERRKILSDYCKEKIKEIKKAPRLKEIYFRKGALVSLASVALGCILTGLIQWLQKEHPINNIVLPKNAIKIYLKSDSLKTQDTSLVRLVK